MNDPELDEALQRAFGWGVHAGPSAMQRVRRIFFDDRGFRPRGFQTTAIERISSGANVLLVAGTAQGKTEAVIAPVAVRLLEAGREYTCCYLAPTRALLNDLFSRLKQPLADVHLNVAVRHGDVRVDEAASDVDVLLTTPESLDIMLSRGAQILTRVRIVVLDEIHQLYGTPRGAQVVSLLERLKAQSNDAPALQRIGLSATVAKPREVAAWMGGSDAGSAPVEVLTAAAGRSISAAVTWCDAEMSVAQAVADAGYHKALVFVNSRRRCEELAAALSDVVPEVLVHYSDLDRTEREYVENRFRKAERVVCVATGTLELGIDIGSIDSVVMADPASSVQAFLQRIGRAARTRTEVPVLVPVRSDAEMTHQLALLSLARRGVIEDDAYPEWFSVIAQQILSIVVGNARGRIFELTPEEIFGCWPWLSSSSALAIFRGLVDAELLVREDDRRSYRKGRNVEGIVSSMGVSSNIAGAVGGIPLYSRGKRVGSLEQGRFREGDVLRYAGRYWRVLGVSATGINMEQTHPVARARIPHWTGRGGASMSQLVAGEMRSILTAGIAPEARMTSGANERWQALLARSAGLPDQRDVVWEHSGAAGNTYYTFAGGLGNELHRLALGERGLAANRVRGRSLGGVALEAPGFLAFNGMAAEETDALLRQHWRVLRSLVQSGPFFDTLPPQLRRQEVLAQIHARDVLAEVTRPARIVPIPQPIFSDG